MRPTIAVASASGPTDGISLDGRAFEGAFRELGYDPVWYQCIDRGMDVQARKGDRSVRGLGFPVATVDQGVNRLWVFPRKLGRVPETILFLLDPTLVNATRRHPRVVVRVHDLKPLTPYADRRVSTWMFRYAIPRLRGVQRIVVPSSAAKEELARFGVVPEIVRVVPETHGLGFHPEHVESAVRRIRETGLVRAVYVAVDRPYKNLGLVIRLAEAMAHESGRSPVRFTILSRLRPETRSWVARLNLPNLSVVPYVESIRELYEANDVLLYPSLHEGFGRPVIEAMSFGLPVIAAHTQPVAEILGPAGRLLDPNDPSSWRSALTEMTDPAAYERAARQSLERGRLFSPESFRDAVASAFGDL